MTIQERVKQLENKICCGRPVFKPTLADFPTTGKDNTLYVDESTGTIYIWDGTTYITADNTVQFVDTLPVTGTEGILYVLPDGTINIWDGAAFITGGVTDHAALTGLTTGDDHTQYLLLAGRTGGQTAIGGTAASNNLTLSSTSNATKGAIIFGDSRYNESTNRLVLGTSAGTGRINLPDAGTTASDGISFGITSQIFRSDVNGSLIYNTGSNGSHSFRINNSIRFQVGDLIDCPIPFLLYPPTLTGSAATSALSITQTWNTTGSPNAINVDITNTASGASANFLDFKLGGVSQISISKFGQFNVANNPAINHAAGIFAIFHAGVQHIRSNSTGTNIGTGALVPSARLSVESTTQGFLPPRGTNAQMLAIAGPVPGLMFYDTTNNLLNVYNGTLWTPL